MPEKNQAALDFLLSRRSRMSRTLVAPYPDRAQMEVLLTAAARTPDHGKLVPWRFIVLEGAALERLADLVEMRGAELEVDPAKVEKLRSAFADAGRIVAVIEVPKESAGVPHIEQSYAVGAACLGLVNAALAAGWGAQWLSGWASHDAEFTRRGLGLAEHERVAGFIHIGTESKVPSERPRPDLAEITEWVTD
ncbi:MAG: nitroreductase [Rhodobacterales bacterium]|nr:MAG: nitroreductase [Rhodobacterales bacterium]